MTESQLQERMIQVTNDSMYKQRAFRKECVTQGIVTFERDDNFPYYTVCYRYCYVTTLFGDEDDQTKLRVMWNTVSTAEQLLKAEQFVRELKESKHEGE